MKISKMMESTSRFFQENPGVSLVKKVPRENMFRPNAATWDNGMMPPKAALIRRGKIKQRRLR
ncbi:MAG: hypothetical protein PHP03_01415 [Candidatus Pacebacteria bacterium]|nr:hypothetical protein [Candidatus Paceibacterota bacterium]